MSFIEKIGFRTRQQLGAFLTVVFSGQIVYAAFESLKGPFYEPLRNILGLSNVEFGTLFSMLGLAMLFYIPGGWINNRFNTRTVLLWGLGYRFISSLILVVFLPPYPVLIVIALSWGILDSVYWPAVVKGIALFSGDNNKGLGFGILSSLRAGGEATLNGILIVLMVLTENSLFTFRIGMFAYTLLAIPMLIIIYKFVPDDPNVEERKHDNKVAAKGLLQCLKHSRVWLTGFMGLCIYWLYIMMIYAAVFLQKVFGTDQAFASTYAVVFPLVIGLLGGVISGWVADYVFKSSTVMLAVSLLCSAGMFVVLIVTPKAQSDLWLNLVLLALCGFFTFLCKAIQQAPVAELGLPNEIMGSAMSVNSFMGFAAILWAYALNGWLIDKYIDAPAIAFSFIFAIGATVAFTGSLLAFVVVYLNKRAKKLQSA